MTTDDAKSDRPRPGALSGRRHNGSQLGSQGLYKKSPEVEVEDRAERPVWDRKC